MIRCSAFCLALSERTARIAATAASQIDRASTGVISFGTASDIGKGRTSWITALELEGSEGLPVVHGILGGTQDSGEYSAITEEEGTLYAGRDLAGTRPLFVGESGEWVASDHRFFRGEASYLLPPGARFEVRAGRVDSSPRLTREPPSNFDEAARMVADLVDRSVRERTEGKRKVGVAFSGGLDSSILAHVASKYAKVVACSVYASGSRDKVNASKGAESLGLDLATEELDRRDVASELSRMDLPFEPSPMDKSLWCIYSVAARAASGAGGELIMLGQLADELFGGYLKYLKAAEERGPGAARKMMEGDVVGCGTRGLIRDEAACSRWLEPRFPFADGRLLKLGMSVPVEFKIRNGVRKALLREAAKLLGVPDELTSSPKKAAQYSSGILKLVD